MTNQDPHQPTNPEASTPTSEDDLERLCEVMHDAYEAAAVAAGWETQQRSRVPWADVPEANKVTMRAAVQALLDHLRRPMDLTAPVEPNDYSGAKDRPTAVLDALVSAARLHTDGDLDTDRLSAIYSGLLIRLAELDRDEQAAQPPLGEAVHIAPGTFVSLDGSVLSHKGRNYVPQDGIDADRVPTWTRLSVNINSDCEAVLRRVCGAEGISATEFTRRAISAFAFLYDDQPLRQMAEAIRLTREYVGPHLLPARQGWSWYEVLAKYAPDVLEAIVQAEGTSTYAFEDDSKPEVAQRPAVAGGPMPVENHMEILEEAEDETGTLVHWRPCRCELARDHTQQGEPWQRGDTLSLRFREVADPNDKLADDPAANVPSKD